MHPSPQSSPQPPVQNVQLAPTNTRVSPSHRKSVSGFTLTVNTLFIGVCLWLMFDTYVFWKNLSVEGVSIKQIGDWLPPTVVLVPFIVLGCALLYWTVETYVNVGRVLGRKVSYYEFVRASLFSSSVGFFGYLIIRFALLITPIANPAVYWADTTSSHHVSVAQIYVSVVFVSVMFLALFYPAIHLEKVLKKQVSPVVPHQPLLTFLIAVGATIPVTLIIYAHDGLGRILVNSNG